MTGPQVFKKLPRSFRTALWGDRQKFGLAPIESDPDWLKWQEISDKFYRATQRFGIGLVINDAGYRVLKNVTFENLSVLEIGGGDIRHLRYWSGAPRKYDLVDVDESMLKMAATKIASLGCAYQTHLVARSAELIPIPDESVDLIVSFYSLEHVQKLGQYAQELHRVLRPGGHVVGAVPAEGGLAWGLGRLFTSRRWLRKNSSLNPDKIICWEHPNFGNEIVEALDKEFTRVNVRLWPFNWIHYDLNLLVKFNYQK